MDQPTAIGRRFCVAALGLLALAGWVLPLSALQQHSPVNPGNPSTLEDFQAGDEDREGRQRATDLVRVTQASSGDWVADVGAGAGYYSMRLSAMVGAKGKVFAEDIWEPALKWLDLQVKLFDLRNVEVVKGDQDNPKLPPDTLNAVLVVNSYHHFAKPQPMCEQILASLKPGGRLVVADYSLPAHRQKTRAEQIKIHEIDPDSGASGADAGRLSSAAV